MKEKIKIFFNILATIILIGVVILFLIALINGILHTDFFWREHLIQSINNSKIF